MVHCAVLLDGSCSCVFCFPHLRRLGTRQPRRWHFPSSDRQLSFGIRNRKSQETKRPLGNTRLDLHWSSWLAIGLRFSLHLLIRNKPRQHLQSWEKIFITMEVAIVTLKSTASYKYSLIISLKGLFRYTNSWYTLWLVSFFMCVSEVETM